MLNASVKAGDEGRRADVFLASQLPQYSRSSLEKLFDQGYVAIGNEVIRASHKLKSGEKVSVDTTLLDRRPEPIDLPVIYEDYDVIVIDKPAGILTHSKGAINEEATVASFIAPKLNDANLKGNRAGIVHRLDRATSGVIIGAKNKAALNWLQKQFSARKTEKLYLAIVEGTPRPEAAIIDAPILRNPLRPQTFKVDAYGKPAQTQYKVLKTNGNRSFVELRPKTGRTHQLRVHMAHIGHPIIGDHIYGHGDGLLLHASSLKLILPDKTSHIFEAPLPKNFKEAVDEL